MSSLFRKLAFFNKLLLLLHLICGNYSPTSAAPKLIRHIRSVRHQRSTNSNNDETKQTFVFRKKSQGVIQYPNKSKASYGNQDLVIWKIYSRRNEKIIVRFDYLDLERNVNSAESCNFDYVKLSNLKGNKEKTLCRSHQIEDMFFESNRNYMEIVFKSDDSIPGTGFSLIFYLINRETNLPAYYEENQQTERKIKPIFLTKSITTKSSPTMNNTKSYTITKYMPTTLKKITTSRPIITQTTDIIPKTKQIKDITTKRKKDYEVKNRVPFISSGETLHIYVKNKSQQNRKGMQTWLLLIIIIIGSAIIFLLSTSLYLLIAGGK